MGSSRVQHLRPVDNSGSAKVKSEHTTIHVPVAILLVILFTGTFNQQQKLGSEVSFVITQNSGHSAATKAADYRKWLMFRKLSGWQFELELRSSKIHEKTPNAIMQNQLIEASQVPKLTCNNRPTTIQLNTHAVDR